jgi:hypothetical protein
VVASRHMLGRDWSPLSERPRVCAAVVYFATTFVYLLLASRPLLREHTSFNHFALLAEAFLQRRLDLGHSPPLYAGGNDFALHGDRWFVVFPPAPALLILPWVGYAGTAERTLDGLFFLLLAGVGPAGMYLTLDRIRRERLASIGTGLVIGLTALYAFGTVYFFTAVQGTVWFAAHVVAAAATTFFLCAAVGARRPLGAGIALGVAIATRPVLGALGLFFLLEWWRAQKPDPHAGAVDRVRDTTDDGRAGPIRPAALRALVWFGLPVAVTMLLLGWYNWARFGSVTEFGYRYLTVAWHARIEKWGLFGYHYFARNLGLMLTSMPYLEHGREGWTMQINGHGVALWVTTPLYLWLLWPRQQSPIHRSLYLTLGVVALPSLLYQNSGWVQFGQRFSNDYAPLLIVLLAVGGYAWSHAMKAAGVLAFLVNLFGAVTFGRSEYARYYFVERTQRVIYQLD